MTDEEKEMERAKEQTVVRIAPIERIKKKCLCCGNEMELFSYEDRSFCDRCFYVVCREVFNKANDGMTVKEIRERIRRNIEECLNKKRRGCRVRL